MDINFSCGLCCTSGIPQCAAGLHPAQLSLEGLVRTALGPPAQDSLGLAPEVLYVYVQDVITVLLYRVELLYLYASVHLTLHLVCIQSIESAMMSLQTQVYTFV